LRLLIVLLLCGATLAVMGQGQGNKTGHRSVKLGPPLTFSTLTTTMSAPHVVTFTNTGVSTVHVYGVSIEGAGAPEFTQSSSCVGILHGGDSCSMTVTFGSTTPGSFSAALVVADDVDLGTQSVTLTGIAALPAPVVTLSTNSINFPSIVAGTKSGTQAVTLTNTGTAMLNLASISLAGTGVNLFNTTNTCGKTVAINGSCTISVGFAPLVPGDYSGVISIADDAADSPQDVMLSAVATPALLTIDTTNATDWKISNGALTIDFNSQAGNIYGMFLVGHPDNLVDVTNTSGGFPKGLYMDNSGFGTSSPTAGFVNGGSYLDWWVTYPSNSKNAYTYSEHFVVFPNDPGVHVYFVANHATTDIAGSIGQVQWVFRDNLTQFINTYTVDEGLNNPGVQRVPLPSSAQMFSTDPGRAVQDATVDMHGFALPDGFTREFYTKYDYSSYEYLHKAHGLFGATYGAWTVLPSQETMVGGPTKQDLIFTGNLLMIEAYSNHLDNSLTLSTPAGKASSRLFGPFYIHFNTFGQAYTEAGNTITTPEDMYSDAVEAGASFQPLYDSEQQLLARGYVPSTARGTVSVQVNGVTGAPHTGWAVLSDPGKNFQYSSAGYEYWADISSTGSATFTGVAPGTYRLSVYALGQWGELRQDGITVTANQATTVPASTFVPENFGTTSPLFTIGLADRSSHEFLHGHDSQGHDDREFWGNWNYWSDFAANQGAVIYNATSGPNGPATNDLNQWNYTHWGTSFNPGLFGGFYNPSDDTTDGYKYVVPSYVANPASTKLPNWQAHFATPQNQTSNYVVLSASLACMYGSYVANLNGHQLVFSRKNISDCMVRSGHSGYTQWVAFQWDASVLNPAGQDNVLLLSASQTQGVSDDALRMELTNSTADPKVTGWHDYEFVYNTTDTPANDAVSNP
jgi:hypothetical protein